MSFRGQLYTLGICLLIFLAYGCADNAENKLQGSIKTIGSVTPDTSRVVDAEGRGTGPIEPSQTARFVLIHSKNESIEITLDSLLSFNSENDLKKVFGANVKRSISGDREGISEYAVSLLYPNSKNQVEFTWKDDSVNFSGLLSISVEGSSDWKTKEGITIGTNLKELEAINGKAFTFYGLGWDYSGLITDWHKGHLDDRKIYGRLGESREETDFDEGLIGDHEIESSSEIAQRANLILVELIMNRPD